MGQDRTRPTVTVVSWSTSTSGNGSAQFAVSDAGTLVYLDDVAQKRHAIAQEPGTTVLAIGGVPINRQMRAEARGLAVIMHAMWSDGTVYIGDPAASETDVSARAVVKDRKLLGAHA